jgi:hypothetical protein
MWYVYSFFSLFKGFFIAKLPSISLPKLFQMDRNRYFFFFFSSSLLKSLNNIFLLKLLHSASQVSMNWSTLVWVKGTQPDFQRWQGGGDGWLASEVQPEIVSYCHNRLPDLWTSQAGAVMSLLTFFIYSLFLSPQFTPVYPSLPQKETGPVLKSFTILKRSV